MNQVVLVEFEDATDNLYPALFQCFTIILCGYIAGRLNVVSATESKGIATFVGTFALPSLIFLSLAQLDFSTVNWTFLGAILLAKGMVFFAVMIVTMLVSKPLNLGRAGIFAIFCTQSNDFALGYPIINALYQKSHPEYALYLYLMAPISLAILNPIAFVLMEINKQREQTPAITIEGESAWCICSRKLLKQIAKGIAFNPVVVMTVLGIFGNAAFKHQLSIYIEGLLEVFGQSFAATALFLLGLRMVGQIHRLRGPALLLPCVLIMVKFLYPKLMKVFSILRNQNQAMASSMVICTFLSAPMMFMSAQMIAINKDFADQLKKFGFDLSIVSLIASIWILFVFIVTKKYKRMPHRLTLCLIVSQSRGPCFVVTLWPVLGFVAWGAPIVMVVVLLATKGTGDLDCKATDAIRLCLLVFCITGMPSSLLFLNYNAFVERSGVGSPTPSRLNTGIVTTSKLLNTHDKGTTYLNSHQSSQRKMLNPSVTDDYALILGCYGAITSSPSPRSPRKQSGCCSDDPNCENGLTASRDIEDIADTKDCACPPSQKHRCTEPGACQYLNELERAAGALGLLPPEQTRGRGGQLLKHTGITYTTWRMMLKDESGVFVEIEFLDIVANYGQALVMFILFGLDPEEILIPTIRFLKTKWYGGDTVVLPSIEDLSFETKHVCDQFITHHLDRCKEAIAKDTRWRMRTYRSVFRGSCLVRWLINCGLAKDEHEAVQYGRHLLDGRLISHVNNAHHFSNSPLLYTFK
ncbi:hypothetical protein HF086_016173 [Spodoptera exigua]|uniref:DEP domain-containing protein n=1 Tax=Spodoptera exigua TaxID=7107 RepID=A0A922MHY2_SPOEX|nr:hypothetical protein HF086_016173 [Spodoptera exigua]